MLSRCFLGFSVAVGVFVIGLSQISSFFSFYLNLEKCIFIPSRNFVASVTPKS